MFYSFWDDVNLIITALVGSSKRCVSKIFYSNRTGTSIANKNIQSLSSYCCFLREATLFHYDLNGRPRKQCAIGDMCCAGSIYL